MDCRSNNFARNSHKVFTSKSNGEMRDTLSVKHRVKSNESIYQSSRYHSYHDYYTANSASSKKVQSRGNSGKSRCNGVSSFSGRNRPFRKDFSDKSNRKYLGRNNYSSNVRPPSFYSKRKSCSRSSQSTVFDSHKDESCATALSHDALDENVCLSHPCHSAVKEDEKTDSHIADDHSSQTAGLMKSLLTYDEETIDVGLILLQLHTDIRINTHCTSSHNRDTFQCTPPISSSSSDAAGEDKCSSASCFNFTHEKACDLTLESESYIPLESPESPVGVDRGFETPPQLLDSLSTATATTSVHKCSNFDSTAILNISDNECNENYCSLSDTMSGLSDISDTTFPSMDDALSIGHLSDGEAGDTMESPQSPEAMERGTSLQVENDDNNDLSFEALSSTCDDLLAFEHDEGERGDLESPQSPTGSDRGPCLSVHFFDSPAHTSSDPSTEESDSSQAPHDYETDENMLHHRMDSFERVL